MTTPYPYQLEGVDKIDTFNGRALLADAMGLGKSYQSLLWAQENASVRPIVIVCPASLKWNWQAEATHHVQMRSEILEGTKVPKRRISSTSQIWIINYDILRHWLSFLKSLKPQLVIVDECHRVSNRSTLRTKATRSLCEGVPHIIALSGTPLTNRPSELWPILNLLRPDLYPSFFSYAHRYCSPHRAPWGWVYDGAEHLDELHRNLLKTCMIRRRKEDVLTDLPAKSRHVVPMQIERRSEYTHAVKDFLNWLRKQKKGNLAKARKAEKLVKVGYLKRLAAELKLPSVMEWLDEFLNETDEKLIVFFVHRLIGNTLHERYPKQSVIMDGSTTGKRRQQAIEQFTRDRKTRIFFGNIEAAGVGWNGTAATTVAFAELAWTPGQHSQAEDRVHRIGQRRATAAYYLVAKDTIEERLAEIIQRKAKTLDTTLDGGTNSTTLSIHDELIHELEESS